MIISADGYLVTNNHVIGENVRGYDVTVAPARQARGQGRVIGVDPTTDLAIAESKRSESRGGAVGDSESAENRRVGVGDRKSLSTQSDGHRRDHQRDWPNGSGLCGLRRLSSRPTRPSTAEIPEEPSLTHGASSSGSIRALFSESGGYQGIGFAVPSNLAHRIIDDLKNYGEVRRGSIGPLSIERLTEQWAEELGVRSTSGALISRMNRNSTPYEAGLRPGDVIVAFQPVRPWTIHRSSSATSSMQRLEQPQPFACCGTAEASNSSFLSSPAHRLLELADKDSGPNCTGCTSLHPVHSCT